MKDLLKKLLRPSYHFIRNIGRRATWLLKAELLNFLLPKAYREEFIFFGDIHTQNYEDHEYLSKKIRMLTHWIDKTFTLDKKISKATLAKNVEHMMQDFVVKNESDRIICRWVNNVLEYYNESQKSCAKKDVVLPSNAPDILHNIIKSRRSARSYKPRKIDDAILSRILEAGLWAPTGCNRQTIEYLVVDDEKDVLFCQKHAGEYYSFPREAAVNIVVLVDPRCYALPRQRHMAYLEGGAAIQNILLSAYSLGLGSCWMFWAKYDQEFNKKFGLQPWLLPVGLVCIGHVDRQPPIVPERKSISDNIYDVRNKD